MGVRLTDFERGIPFAGDYGAALEKLSLQLSRSQLAQVVHGCRAILVFEGWEGSGKKRALRRLAAAWDPCHFDAHCVRADGFEQNDRHWLTPYWAALPPSGKTALFYRSWYSRLVAERAKGDLSDKAWLRAFDEINEFEAQQAEHGSLLVKLFFHVSEDVQWHRLHERQEDDWQRCLLHPDDMISHSQRDAHAKAWEEAFELSDTRWAPWTLIDAGDAREADLAALSAVANAFGQAIPSEPPGEENVVELHHGRGS